MKLIKLSSDHYIIVDESKQPVDGYYYDEFIKNIRDTRGAEYGQADHCWQITHSTQPLEDIEVDKYVPRMPIYDLVKPLSLSEVKELLGEDVDVERKAEETYRRFPSTPKEHSDWGYGEDINVHRKRKAFVKGYLQALEDNKDRKYTEEDMRRAYYKGATDCHDKCTERNWRGVELKVSVDSLIDLCSTYIQSLQPPTSWDVTFVDGKFKLI